MFAPGELARRDEVREKEVLNVQRRHSFRPVMIAAASERLKNCGVGPAKRSKRATRHCSIPNFGGVSSATRINLPLARFNLNPRLGAAGCHHDRRLVLTRRDPYDTGIEVSPGFLCRVDLR